MTLPPMATCRPDDGYSKPAAGATLQECFLECARDSRCKNVFLEYMDVVWLEKPPAALARARPGLLSALSISL
jgi:hypothetical protein